MLETRLLSLLACPVCHGALEEFGESLNCVRCHSDHAIEGGIPVLFDAAEVQANARTRFDYLKHYQKDAQAFDYFEEQRGATAHSERRLREYILSLIPANAGTVLDVGCGSAWIAKRFQRSQTFVCSLDVSLTNTRGALDRYPSPNHVAVVADSYALPFRDDAFDVVVASEVIEHLIDPARFAAELLRVVKAGGCVIVSTPFEEKIIQEMCVHCQQLTPHNAHLHSFDEKKLTALFKMTSAARPEFFAFNNKLLLYGRTYPILQHLPFAAWAAVDRAASLVVNKKVNCIVRATKAAGATAAKS